MFEVRKTGVYARWLDGLWDTRARGRVLVRVERLAAGNPGDVRAVGEGVSELRIDYGPGYRVYYKRQGRAVVVSCWPAGTSVPRTTTSRRRFVSHGTSRWTT